MTSHVVSEVTGHNPLSDHTIVDKATHDRLAEWGGRPLLAQLLRLYLETAPERLAEIEAGVADGGDLDGAHRAAHALKSSAANVGAVEVSGLAAALERSSAAGERARSRGEAHDLVRAARRADAELTRILGTLD